MENLYQKEKNTMNDNIAKILVHFFNEQISF